MQPTDAHRVEVRPCYGVVLARSGGGRRADGCERLVRSALSLQGQQRVSAGAIAQGGGVAEHALGAGKHAPDYALIDAVEFDRMEVVCMLLAAGADPTAVDDGGGALSFARLYGKLEYLPLFKRGAKAERARLLLKARAILDAAFVVGKARTRCAERGRHARQRQARSGGGGPRLPQATRGTGPRAATGGGGILWDVCGDGMRAVRAGAGGRGGVALSGALPHVGMLKEVPVELCEIIVPGLARDNMQFCFGVDAWALKECKAKMECDGLDWRIVCGWVFGRRWHRLGGSIDPTDRSID